MNRILVQLLRFCLCRRVSFAQSSYWLINSYPAPGVQIVECATLRYLRAWNRLINYCSLLSLAQILAKTSPLSIHHSPFPADKQDPVGTFPAPPDPTGKVCCPSSRPCLLNHRCNKTYWRVTPFAPIRSGTSVRRGQTSVFFCEI